MLAMLAGGKDEYKDWLYLDKYSRMHEDQERVSDIREGGELCYYTWIIKPNMRHHSDCLPHSGTKIGRYL